MHSTPADDPSDLRFHFLLTCPCGKTLDGSSEDEIVLAAFAHLREKHAERADDYEREDILAMARRLVRR